MRRPTLCSGGVSEGGDGSSPGQGRLSRVKRVLAGSLLPSRRPRVFGIRLEELPQGPDGVPAVLARLCAYIEVHGMRCGGLFRLSAGNPKLVERLRASFDRSGDADLEGAGDAATVASLLKLWLRDLPEPLLPASVVTELVAVHDKLHDEPSQWRDTVSQCLLSLPDAQLRALRFLLRFLLRYEQQVARAQQCHHHTAGGLAAIFSPLLLRNQAHPLMAKLIHESQHIFHDRLVDHAIQVAVGGGDLRLFSPGGTANAQPQQVNAAVIVAGAHKQRKRKERHESFNSQSQERKVIRSNSEERPLEDSNSNCKDSIRRVSSHEDFSLVKGANRNTNNNNNNSKNTSKSFLSEFIDPAMGHGVRASGLPLHERNSTPNGTSHSKLCEDENATLAVAELFDDNEHERRRSCERFARAVAPRGRRNMARRRRTVHKGTKASPEDTDGGGSSKENEDQERTNSRSPHQPLSVSTTPNNNSSAEDEGGSSQSSSAHSFLQLHPQERERSPSPAPSPCTPPLDLSTLHQQVDCSEPLTSHAIRGLEEGEAEELVASSRLVLSPRNSMILTRRVYLDPNVPPSPPHEHSTRSVETRIKQMGKQVHSMKKKLRRFEEQFELEFGYRPSHSDKMANKEVKKLCTELNKLRKEMKQLKEDPHSTLLVDEEPPVDGGHTEMSQHGSGKKPGTVEEMLQEVDKHLADKRQLAKRPEILEDLTRDQLLDEKVAVQKALLYMEGVFGRPVTKIDRDLVRPLYDRYRALKRMVIRTNPAKLKDSISELATILEHETMDFISSPPSLSIQDDPVNQAAELAEMHLSASSESLWENLHSLPLSELLNQQRSTREEKKCLRRSLREFEEDFQRRTGKKLQREDRVPMENVYTSYKQAKAKLRLLDALAAKQT